MNLKILVAFWVLFCSADLSAQNKVGYFDYDLLKKSLVEYVNEAQQINKLEAQYNDSLIPNEFYKGAINSVSHFELIKRFPAGTKK